MLSYGLEQAATAEVVAAYSAPQTVVPAVSATPGWHVIGTFYLPKNARAKLEALVQVSKSGVTANLRLFDLHALQPVSGATVQSTSETPEIRRSPTVQLAGQRRYQIQAEALAHTPDDETFAVVSTASITN